MMKEEMQFNPFNRPKEKRNPAFLQTRKTLDRDDVNPLSRSLAEVHPSMLTALPGLLAACLAKSRETKGEDERKQSVPYLYFDNNSKGSAGRQSLLVAG